MNIDRMTNIPEDIEIEKYVKKLLKPMPLKSHYTPREMKKFIYTILLFQNIIYDNYLHLVSDHTDYCNLYIKFIKPMSRHVRHIVSKLEQREKRRKNKECVRNVSTKSKRGLQFILQHNILKYEIFGFIEDTSHILSEHVKEITKICKLQNNQLYIILSERRDMAYLNDEDLNLLKFDFFVEEVQRFKNELEYIYETYEDIEDIKRDVEEDFTIYRHLFT